MAVAPQCAFGAPDHAGPVVFPACGVHVYFSRDLSAIGRQSRAFRCRLSYFARLAGSGEDRADAGSVRPGTIFFHKDLWAQRLESTGDSLRCELRRRSSRVWHPCRLRFRRNFFRLIPEQHRLPWRPSFRRRRPGASLSLPQCGSVGIWKDAPGPPRQNFNFSALAVLPRQGPAPAEFLVAVSPDGLPMHLFPQQSSGNENLDRAALRYLAGCRFAAAPSEREPAWGTATFLWGADVRQDSQQ